MCLTEITYSK